ncbi:MAG: calcium/sodium antiporter [Flavobacteriaceae bacterium]
MLNFAFVVCGLALLILGGEYLLKSSVSLSLKLNVSKLVIGMTVVSFATSAPELLVSVNAAVSGIPDLSLGNVVGSNIANLGLVLGVTLLLGTITIEPSFYKIDWPMLMIATITFYTFVVFDYELDATEGLLMFLGLILFLIYLLSSANKKGVVDELAADDVVLNWNSTMIYLFIGGIGLWGGSELLVRGSKALAEDFGVSDRVIGITIVSVGTSIPELAASIIAMIKKEKAISIGNLIGSNIFNLFAVLGITAMITPIPVGDSNLIDSDAVYMLVISALLLMLVFIPSKMKLGWRDGLILLSFYIYFIYQVI